MANGPTGNRGLSDWQRRHLSQMLNSWRASNFDPYVVLGLQKPASPEEIAGAYRRLVKEYHPDLHFNDPIALEILKQINVARDKLNWSVQSNRDADFQPSNSYGYSRNSRQREAPTERPRSRTEDPTDPSDQGRARPKTGKRNFNKIVFQLSISAAIVAALFVLFVIVFDSSDELSTNNPSGSDTQSTSGNATASALIHTTETSRDVTPEPTPATEAASESSDSDLDQWRQYALKVINQERQKVGLNKVRLVDNTATQQHAEDMKENCFVSPWGTDGMKPYMRYTLSGGHQHSSEIVYGSNFCPTFTFLYERESIQQQINDAIDQSIKNDELGSDVLDPHARFVAIGFAYREPSLWAVLTFIGDHVVYETLPFIHNQKLQLSVTGKNGVDFASDDLTVIVFYDELPSELRRSQLHQTSCYGHGELIASINQPLEPGWYYQDDTFAFPSEKCVDPYDIPVDSRPVDSADEQPTPTPMPIIEEGILMVADTWEADANRFQFAADIDVLTSLFGNGVYTVALHASIDGEFAPISEYSIFVPAPPN